ncbi:MAG: hypothetical protein J5379_07970 [Clostridiales bacterium]|nr:hypothetical protein [Clostridiales bacterium]
MDNKEISVRVSDIFASFLKSILFIIITTIIVAGLCGAFGIYKARKVKVDTSTINSNIKILRADLVEKEDALHELEKLSNTAKNYTIPYTEKKIVWDQSLADSRRAYLEQSIYAQIDPLNCGMATITFSVDTVLPETVTEDFAEYKSNELSRIVTACTCMYPFSDDVMNQVQSLLSTDVDRKFVEELISIASENDQFVKISVCYTNPEQAKKVADYLFSQISSKLSEIYPDSSVAVIGTFTGYTVNWEMNSAHISYEDSLLQAEKNLAQDQDTIAQSYKLVEDNQKMIDDANTEITRIQNNIAANQRKYNVTVSKKDMLKSGIKFGLVGIFVGLALACALVYVRDILGGKVRNRNNIVSRYSYPLLGVLPASKKRPFEKTVRRLEGDSLYSDEDIISSSAESVLAAASVDGSKTCLIGTADVKSPAFSEMLKDLKGKMEFKGNILAGSEAIKALDGFDKVILVEQRNASRYDAINDEISKIHALKKEVLGIVLL